MSEQDKPFVINDRRKFRMDGELREPNTTAEKTSPAETAASSPAAPDEAKAAAGATHAATEGSSKVISFPETAAHREQAAEESAKESGAAGHNAAHSVTPVPEPGENAPGQGDDEANLPAPPTDEEFAQVQKAYEATAERLDTVMRATNPGGDHLPPMDFQRLVQSIYMTAMVQLGAGTPQGEQARVDLLGAKQSIDMLGVIAAKTENSLDSKEKTLIDSALFELRMGFLEITQLLARQSSGRQGGPGGATPFGAPGGTGAGPRIVS